MDLEKISASIKPRNGWQSIDLGILMVRNWWKPLIGSWFLLALPVFIILNGFYFVAPWLPILLFWWLKPVFESMLLYFLSHALFGDYPSVKDIIRKFPSQMGREIISFLTIRRFSPYRSFSMPVAQLEQLKGKPGRVRTSMLLKTVDSKILGFILFCSQLEMLLFISILGSAAIFIPYESLKSILNSIVNGEFKEAAFLVRSIGIFLAIGFVAPFHIAGGFSVYINRRASLEGWDIELIFRRIARRFKEKPFESKGQNSLLKKTLLSILFLGISISSSSYTSAEEIHTERIKVKKQIEEILSGETFYKQKTITRYRFKEDIFKQKEQKDTSDLNKYVKMIVVWIARSIEFILWSGLIILLLYIVYKYRSWLLQFMGIQTEIASKAQVQETLFGLDIRASSLPENIPSTVMDLWNKGQKREAVGLLFRGTLSKMITRFSLVFPESYTEQECVDLVTEKHSNDINAYFKSLVNQWQLLAYGHQFPETELIESLCKEWTLLFEQNGSE